MSSTLSAKLSNLFKLRRPVEVDAHGRMTPLSARSNREATLQQLKSGYMEVVDTMQALRSHMEEQARRSDRLLTMMEGLPEVLRSIPETNRAQTDVLNAIQGQMRTQTESTGQLSTALTDLAGATQKQQTALGELQKQMQTSNEQGASLRDSLGILSETMEHVTDASRSNVEAVNHIADQSRSNDKRLRELFHRTQKHTTVMSTVSWALALVSLGIAGYVAVMVANVAEQAGKQQPVVIEQARTQVPPTYAAGAGWTTPLLQAMPPAGPTGDRAAAAPADEGLADAAPTQASAAVTSDEASETSDAPQASAPTASEQAQADADAGGEAAESMGDQAAATEPDAAGEPADRAEELILSPTDDTADIPAADHEAAAASEADRLAEFGELPEPDRP